MSVLEYMSLWRNVRGVPADRHRGSHGHSDGPTGPTTAAPPAWWGILRCDEGTETFLWCYDGGVSYHYVYLGLGWPHYSFPRWRTDVSSQPPNKMQLLSPNYKNVFCVLFLAREREMARLFLSSPIKSQVKTLSGPTGCELLISSSERRVSMWRLERWSDL